MPENYNSNSKNLSKIDNTPQRTSEITPNETPTKLSDYGETKVKKVQDLIVKFGTNLKMTSDGLAQQIKVALGIPQAQNLGDALINEISYQCEKAGRKFQEGVEYTFSEDGINDRQKTYSKIDKISKEVSNSITTAGSVALAAVTAVNVVVPVILSPNPTQEAVNKIGDGIEGAGKIARDVQDFVGENWSKGYNNQPSIKDIDNFNNPKVKNVEKLVDTDKDGIPDVVEKTAGEVDPIKSK